MLIGSVIIASIVFLLIHTFIDAEQIHDNQQLQPDKHIYSNDANEVSYQATTLVYKHIFDNYNPKLQYELPTINKYGIITAKTVNLRSTPSTTWGVKILHTLSKDEEVIILAENSRWFQVSYNGIKGWILKEYLNTRVELTTKETNGLPIRLLFKDRNTLSISLPSTNHLALHNHKDGKFTISGFPPLSKSSFDVDHRSVPVFSVSDGTIDIYTTGWTHAELRKDAESEYTLYFTPVVLDTFVTQKNNRDIINIVTSGDPAYSFITEDKSVDIAFDETVNNQIPVKHIPKGLYLDSIQISPRLIQIKSHQVTTWKVYPDRNSITIDLSATGIKGKRIVIDPGHGGSEPGTYGRVLGILEKDFNLSVSMRLKQHLEREGAIVHLTRSTDNTLYNGDNYETFLDLMERIHFTNSVDADLFVSVHADNFPADLSLNGTASFYYDEAPHSFQNQKLASLLSAKVAEAIETKWLGNQPQSFVVIRYNRYPSVLMELGFLSNKNDEAKLIDPIYQDKMSQAMTEAIIEYFTTP